MPRNTKEITEINRIAGQRVHELRIVNGMSREELAEEIEVTHQQLQKYERGTNRISIGRLVLVARVFKRPINYFLDENPEGVINLPTKHKRMAIEVSRNFMKISNPRIQDACNDMVRILSEESACTP